MLESLSDYLVHKYLANLQQELVIQGLASERIQQVLTESEAHLTEAIEHINPASGAEIERVIQQFGSPAALAHQLSKQDLRASTRRQNLWPLAVVPVVLLGLSNRALMTQRIIGDLVSVTWLFLLAMGFVLLCLGFRARKPILLGFGVLAAIMIGLQTIWLGIATYPVTYREATIGPWIETVGRFEVKNQMGSWRKMIAKEQEVVQAIKQGKQIFSAGNTSRSVPEMFTYNGKYWLPEGVRESVLFGQDDRDILPQLRVATRDEAVAAWTSQPFGPSADQIIEEEPHTVALYANCLRNLEWIQNRSIFVRFGMAFRKVAPQDAILCALALLATNAGWIVWLLGRWLERTQRRRTTRTEALV